MVLPPAVIVHNAAQARAARGAGEVTLVSAANAVFYGGCLWWQKLLEGAGGAGPAFLDCGDAPGRALEALRLGLGGVILRCEQERFNIIAIIAGETGAVVLPETPAALDLGLPGALGALPLWVADSAAYSRGG